MKYVLFKMNTEILEINFDDKIPIGNEYIYLEIPFQNNFFAYAFTNFKKRKIQV